PSERRRIASVASSAAIGESESSRSARTGCIQDWYRGTNITQPRPGAPARRVELTRDGQPSPGDTQQRAHIPNPSVDAATRRSIAERLIVSEKAVVKHVSHIYDALGLDPSAADHRRVLAVVRYLAP
ncbi:MAG: hypothetical protein M3O70_05120, partial [Actinomycetota bacterium]|nr:hypothetical protein [Actinomycetota bacterium]